MPPAKGRRTTGRRVRSGAPLRALIQTGQLSSVILWGPPGSGKTTIARVVATCTDRAFIALSAVTAGVKDVREIVDAAGRRVVDENRGTIPFLDEVHRMAEGDGRAALTTLEVALALAAGDGPRSRKGRTPAPSPAAW